MEKINLAYSLKNIPISDERSYKLQFIEKIEIFIKRMWWKAIFFNNKDKPDDHKEQRYRLKTSNCALQVNEMIPFEDDLIQLVKRITFLVL